jgi:hypothetical protein
MAVIKHAIQVSIDNEPEVVVEVVVDRDKEIFTLRVRRGSEKSPIIAEATWKVDLLRKTMTYIPTMRYQANADWQCLSSCLIGAGAGLLGCLAAATTEEEVWACLGANAVATGVGAVGCVLACLKIKKKTDQEPKTDETK